MSAAFASSGVSGDDARRLIAEAPIASRTDIINLLVRCFGFQRYLEVGLGDPSWNFERIVAPDRQSVDPLAAATFRVPSDQFFGSGLGHERYDVVFIDGLHEFQQCLRDIENALARLSPTGFIVIHDANPPTEWHQRPPHEAGYGDWNGTVWKAIVAFRRRHPEIWLRTVDVDWGCAVLHAATRDGDAANAAALPDVDALAWSGLDQNRAAWLNLISVEDFRQRLIEMAQPAGDAAATPDLADRSRPIISVCYTSARPSVIPGQVREWLERAGDREAIEFVVTIDAESAAHSDALSQLPHTRVFVNQGRPCCVDGWNLAARKSRGDILIQCSDDLHPPAGWDASIRARLNDGAGKAVLAVSDGFTASANFIPHAIVTRGYYNDFGYLFHDAYGSMWSDNELSSVAHQRQAVINGLDIAFGHSHGQMHDEVRARHEGRMHGGVATFRFREQNGFRPWKLDSFTPEDRDSDGIYSPNWSARPAVYWKAGPRSADDYLDLHRQSARRRAAMFGAKPQSADLQVLIPTIPARRQLLELLTAELTRQGVPFLIDDRPDVTVGDKRTELMARATAPYLTFIDDDDWVSHNYGEIIGDAIANNRHELDAILHDMVTTVDDGMPRATFLSFEHGHQDLEDCYLRLPNHFMVWKSDVARREPFAAIDILEDTDWAGRMQAHAPRWARIHGFLYFSEPRGLRHSTDPSGS